MIIDDISMVRMDSRDPLEHLYPLPVPVPCEARTPSAEETNNIQYCQRLQFFLATAPTHWITDNGLAFSNILQFRLPSAESVSCVLWNGLYHISGTDIVRALAYRFEAFGRPVNLVKKWEEGVFSDLRNLKPGADASLEEPKSPLLDYLFRNGCIRTQKKQKVFYWFSVPHDRLFLDALERDLKREKAGLEPTTVVTGEPARSFQYDPTKGLFEQFAGTNPGFKGVIPTASSTRALTGSPTATARGSEQPLDQLGFVFQPMHEVQPALFNDPSPFGSSRLENLAFDGARMGSALSRPYKSRTRRNRETSTSTLGTVVKDRRARSALSRETTGGSQRLADQDDTATGSQSSVGRDSASAPAEDARHFDCPVRFCGKAFKRLEHLKRHVLTHTRQRPHACHYCARCFSRSDNLQQHMRTHDVPSEAPADLFALDATGQCSTPLPPAGYGRAFSAAPASEDPLYVPIDHDMWTTQEDLPSAEVSLSQRSSTVPPGWQTYQYGII